MNVFVVGWSESGRADLTLALGALDASDLVREKLGGVVPRGWASPDGHVVVASVEHSASEVPGARYLHLENDRMALFAGRPFVWTDEYRADGVSTLDAAFFVTRSLSGDDLDGRLAVVRYEGATGTLEVLTDRLGAYPLFAADGAGMTWFGNTPFAVARASGRMDLDAEALGSFLSIGWSLGGRPIWSGVRRLPRATLEVHRRGGRAVSTDLLPARTIAGFFGQAPDMVNAARVLTATVSAQGSWPGRPNVVPISGGRDSRVILAAALAVGLDFSSRTLAFPRAAGYPETPDVVIGGEVMAAVGRERAVVTPSEEGGLRWSAHLVRQATHGLISLLETGLIPSYAGGSPLEVIHSGGGGELSRGLLFLGDDPTDREVSSSVFRNWVHRVPHPITRGETLETVARYIGEWVGRHRELGFASSDLPDAFWLFERLQCWLAPPQHLQELSNDTTAPLWSLRMLPFTFAGTSRSRTGEPLHYGLLSELAPGLMRIRFDGISPSWPSFPASARHARRQRDLAFKVRREAQRRFEARRRERRGVLDPLLDSARRDVVTALSSLDGHVAWDVLDRKRTMKLLTRDLYTLDPRSQSTIWRLATVLCADLPLE